MCHPRDFRVSLQMPPQMYLQILFPNRCKGTLVAFVCFFARVNFHMCLQIACPTRCKVTLVAFEWFFSKVNFHMCLQIALLNGRKATLHYRLRAIRSGRFGVVNFASHFICIKISQMDGCPGGGGVHRFRNYS